MMMPSASEYAEFPFGSKFAGWAIVNDSMRDSLNEWIDVITMEKQNDPEWELLSVVLPNGYAFVGVVYIQTWDTLVAGDYFLAGVRLDGSGDEGSFSAYYGVTENGPEFKTYIGLPMAENGFDTQPDFSLAHEHKMPGFNGLSGGLGGQYGQVINDELWRLWVWSYDEEEN